MLTFPLGDYHFKVHLSIFIKELLPGKQLKHLVTLKL